VSEITQKQSRSPATFSNCGAPSHSLTRVTHNLEVEVAICPSMMPHRMMWNLDYKLVTQVIQVSLQVVMWMLSSLNISFHYQAAY
jgi:hypothetical protein